VATDEPPRFRRRGPELEAAILDAAWEELASVGAGNLTMGAVASRAKTSKAALYRRWPNRTELAVAAIDRRVPDLGDAVPDTGTLRGDLLAVLERLAHRYRGLDQIPGDGAELAAHLRRRAARDTGDQMRRVLLRAAGRGELDLRAVHARIARLPIDLVHAELFLVGEPVTADTLAEIVDVVVLPLLTPRGAGDAPAEPGPARWQRRPDLG
jgi:AcrR family transcriptional regulator